MDPLTFLPERLVWPQSRYCSRQPIKPDLGARLSGRQHRRLLQANIDLRFCRHLPLETGGLYANELARLFEFEPYDKGAEKSFSKHLVKL